MFNHFSRYHSFLGLTLREALKEELLKRELTVITEVRIEHNMVRRLIYPSMTK